MVELTCPVVNGTTARAVIAAIVARHDVQSLELGAIQLQSHQLSAVARIGRAMNEFGGALLCDPVGTGKTYIALALASQGETLLVVAPAVLRPMWMRASSVAGRRMEFLSFEALSRRSTARDTHRLIVVDEAHHARNPCTIRYEYLSRLCSGRQVLLLTATPIHNRSSDLASLLALFMGSRATALTSAELGRCVIRRAELSRSLASIPETEEVVWCRIREDDRMPCALLDLSPPLPASDGGDGGALVAHSLIRQWASSDAALIGALQRRLTRAEALIAALEDGTWPSKSELRSWISGEDSIQLAFAGLLAQPTTQSHSLLPVVRRHRNAVRGVLDLARGSVTDRDRAAVIRQLRGAWAGRKIVVFSQYADSVDGLFRLLCGDGGVASLTGSGGRVAGGQLSRSEVIERFAPRAAGVSPPSRSETVSLLITTDLLSEGVNLQDAGVVIHLDLPWTPARIEQRLGRIARLGSQHERVASYALKPPASSDTVIRIESILKRKLQESGVVSAMLPSFGEWSLEVSPKESMPLVDETLRHMIRSWAGDPGHRVNTPAIAAVHTPHSGFLAIITAADSVRFVGSIDGSTGDDPCIVLECAKLCMGSDAKLSHEDLDAARATLDNWLQSDTATASARVSSLMRSSARNRAVRRIDRAVRNARPHARPGIRQKAETARTMVQLGFGIHAETRLSELCDVAESDEAWLDRVIAFGHEVSIGGPAEPGGQSLLAMILFTGR